MPARLATPVALLVLAACSSPAEVAERTGVDRSQDLSASASASSGGTKGKAVSVEEENDLFSYELAYPAEVGAYPELAAKIEGDARRAKDEMIANAKQERAQREGEKYPFNPHSLSEDWKVVTDIPGYLSLSNEFATYTGGAHGMYGLTGIVWDKANKRAFESDELFQSADYLGSIMDRTLCDALNRERVKKGSEPIPQEADTIFPACPSLSEATVLVGSSNGKTFDRITVYYGPYVAGSYAEGAYELDFPMTAAMLEAVKPAYRAAFSAGR